MPVGVIVNCLAVAIGGALGGACGDKFSGRLKQELTMIFGLCAIGMGVYSTMSMKALPPVIFSVIVGTALGLILHLGDRLDRLLAGLQKPLARLMPGKAMDMDRDGYAGAFITVLVLFCASANGIYGTLDAGFSGDHTILISKSIMDLFTAVIFACDLGIMVSLIAIPQFCIFVTIFCLAKVIYPLVTPEMISDFKGCGGFLLLATGFRIMKVREFPVADMIPAMLLVMPVSWLWANCIMPSL